MKKIINIKLSGSVIPIEDAAYESLQEYIESLRRYFVHEEGRDEIINDIESRIAELMDDKVKKGAAAVTEADILTIIDSMGRVEDFEQADPTEGAAASPNSQGTGPSQSYTEAKRPRGRLYRDVNDKILGGVCSGIAKYLNVDPAIVRILLVLLIFGAGTGILLYIILWIVLPARPLPGTTGKRLFRNPDDKIISGVAGGIAAYFNKEAWVFRLIFAAPLLLNIVFGILNGIFFAFDRDIFPNLFIGSFTGTFVITYIILSIILPEAKTPFEKMEMRGENVDVNRIRQNVKDEMNTLKSRAQSFGAEVRSSAQNLGAQAREFADTRGRAFASEAAQASKPIASGIGYIIGLLFKIFLFFVLGVLAFAFFMFVIVFVFGGVGEIAKDFILEGFWQKLFAWLSILLFFGVPMIALITWLVRRIMKVRSRSRYLGWTFGGLWTIGIISLVFFIASMTRSFRYYSKLPQEIGITQPENKMIVNVNEPEISYSGTFHWLNIKGSDGSGWDLSNDSLKLSNVKLRIDKSEDSLYHVTIWRYSAGRTLTEAQKRAEQIVFNVSSLDSNLNLGSGFGISKFQKFRGQKIIIEIRMPVGKRILFDETINERLNPYEVRIRERFDRRGREWDIDWDNDSYYNWESGVEYIMMDNGELLSAEQVDAKKNKTNIKTENDADKLKKEIEEKEKQLEIQKRQLDEIEEKKQQKKKTDDGTTKAKKRNEPVAQMELQLFSLFI